MRNSLSAGRARRRAGISMLEMVVTLLILAIVISAVFMVYRNTINNSRSVTLKVERQAAIQGALDKLMDDVVAAAFSRPKVYIQGEAREGVQTTLTITTETEEVAMGPVTRVDWVAAEGETENEMTLYRRQVVGEDEGAYVPLCEHIYSFEPELFSPEGLEDPNMPPSMLDVQVKVYQDDPPDPRRTYTIFRTFCLRRK